MKNNKVARKNEDFRIHYTDYFGIIRYSESLTNHAKSNSEFEGHVHYDEFELYYFIKGDISFSVEGRRIAVKEGDMIIIVSGLIHRPIINRECVYHRRHILFHKDIFKRLNGTDYEFFRMLMKKKIWVLDRCVVKEKGFDTMYNQIEAYVRNQTAYAGFCGMIEIFSFLVRAQECGRELLDIDEQMYNEKVEMLLKYIEEHLTETLNYEVLAEAFYFSTKNLYKFPLLGAGFMEV